MKYFPILFVLFFILTGCRAFSNDETHEWIKKQNEAKALQTQENEKNARELAVKLKEKNEKFELEHPEVLYPPLDISNLSGNEARIATVLNELGFVTRFPETQDANQVYVKVGGYHLTLKNIEISIIEQTDECKRISAYTGSNVGSYCLKNILSGLSDFAKIIKNNKITGIAKEAALGDATFGGYIDFEHAARLAKMHHELCAQKSNTGYVAMSTVAVPCSGNGDVLTIDAARKVGEL